MALTQRWKRTHCLPLISLRAAIYQRFGVNSIPACAGMTGTCRKDAFNQAPSGAELFFSYPTDINSYFRGLARSPTPVSAI